MTLGFLLDYAVGINETHSVLYFSVYEAGSFQPLHLSESRDHLLGRLWRGVGLAASHKGRILESAKSNLVTSLRWFRAGSGASQTIGLISIPRLGPEKMLQFSG